MAFVKPADMFDRDEEWAALSRFVADDRAGATLGVISGRRRQGKTFLLDALCQASDGFFFEATEATDAESLRRIGGLIGEFTNAPVPPRPADWHEVLDALLRLGADCPVTAVIDELPYLVKGNPALPSVIQAAFGPRREERVGSRTRLLLCGSAMSFMGGLLSGTAPLRGRAALEMVVPTLDFRLAAQFWSITDPQLAVLLYSVVGGTPAYRDGVAGGQAPQSAGDFDRWVVDNVLNRFSPLFREARYLIAEEPDIRDNAVYHTVLAAVADGNSTRGGIAAYLERKATDISHHLSVLEDAGLLTREVDAFRPGRSVYRISEPLITFYHAIMRPEWSRLERRGLAAQVWRDSARRFAGSVVGPRFEQVCRDWIQDYAPADITGGAVARVGTGVVNDSEHRTSHQVDVAVFGNDTAGHRVLLALGEAKWQEPMGAGHLARLQRVRELLARSGQPGAGTARLLCFGATQPSEQLHAAASRGEVQLIGLADLYGRSLAGQQMISDDDSRINLLRPGQVGRMRMPPARGALSSWLAATLRRSPSAIPAAVSAPPVPGGNSAAWEDEDLQLALWCCYELHYRGFEDVDEDWEWHPAVLAFRGSLERRWLTSLRDLAGEHEAVPADAVPGALRELTGRGGGPDLAGYLARKAGRDQFAEFIGHRSVYQLKEADPHSFGIPRLDGAVKAALVEIQADEYGGGRPERMHAELFRATMRWLELDDSYGHYVPAVPAVTLAVSNLMSLFALHRRWTGALLGHLAALEMTSTGPNRLYSAGARRLGASAQQRRYFDEHVEADAVHEQIAAHDLCGGYAADHPTAAADVLFGAACCLALDDALAGYLLSRWQAGQPAPRPPAEPLRAA